MIVISKAYRPVFLYIITESKLVLTQKNRIANCSDKTRTLHVPLNSTLHNRRIDTFIGIYIRV